ELITEPCGLLRNEFGQTGAPCFERSRQGKVAQWIGLQGLGKTARKDGGLLTDPGSYWNQDGQGDSNQGEVYDRERQSAGYLARGVALHPVDQGSNQMREKDRQRENHQN